MKDTSIQNNDMKNINNDCDETLFLKIINVLTFVQHFQTQSCTPTKEKKKLAVIYIFCCLVYQYFFFY